MAISPEDIFRAIRFRFSKTSYSPHLSRVGDFFQNISRLFSRVYVIAATVKARFPREKQVFFGNSFSRRCFMIRYIFPVALPVRKAWGMPPCHRGKWFFVPRISFFSLFLSSRSSRTSQKGRHIINWIPRRLQQNDPERGHLARPACGQTPASWLCYALIILGRRSSRSPRPRHALWES